MGFLEKILRGEKNENGITNKIDIETQAINKRLFDAEKEKNERIRLGQEIESYYIGESRRNGFPYDCFFEWEYEMVERAMHADETLDGTMEIVMCARDYIMHNRELDDSSDLKKFNVSHSKIWIEELLSRARKGSYYAKAAVSGRYFADFPEIDEMISGEVNSDIKQSYQDEVKAACAVNDKSALVACAYFLMIGKENENARKELYLKAGQLGSSEAYYKLFFSVKNCWNSVEGLKYVVAGAECDDGEKAYEFQDKLGDAYYYGDGWNLDVDKSIGIYWYKRAAANGYASSVRTLEMLQSKGEI